MYVPKFQPCAGGNAPVTTLDERREPFRRVVVPPAKPPPRWKSALPRWFVSGNSLSDPTYPQCPEKKTMSTTDSMTTRTVGRFRSAKETLRSRGSLPFASNGTMWHDPRFPVVTQKRVPGTAPAPPTHAGGNYYNALISNSMLMSTDMRSGYVRGYGDGQDLA